LRDIGGAKVKGNLDPEFRRKIHAVADLHGEMALGRCNNGLPIETDEIDPPPCRGIPLRENLQPLPAWRSVIMASACASEPGRARRSSSDAASVTAPRNNARSASA